MPNSDSDEMISKSLANLVGPGVVAVLFGVHPDSIRRWARAGKIPAVVLPSGRFLFDAEKVLGMVKSVGATANV